ncbi:uncharacterized protein LOC116616705 [Nematostella vectensis]|uniref:uncharacterized protein LOC116616705 n=1 Tax=Nematostella vectensis TaxID=45351 RepID=UPI00207718E5|nr:uncharacterized protein LOC116616705 [Nematostella vectensis]
MARRRRRSQARHIRYIDDLYTSCEDVGEAVKLREDVTALMAEGGFPMRKWMSSSAEVLATVPETERAVRNEALEMGELPQGRALGVRWDPQSDTLGFAFAHVERPPAEETKRGVLKKLAGLYDPLGWASPYVVRAKVMLQRTSSRGIDWDELLPSDLRLEWSKWEAEMVALKSFVVPRYIYRQPAVAYVRATSTVGEVTCHLVIAKTRLMPLKPISIPRGELMACQLAVRLAKAACVQLSLSMREVIYLSDSTTALWWIRGEPRNFKPFVANRVAEILTESDLIQWHHVRTEMNIADVATTEASAGDIQAHTTWIERPEFLSWLKLRRVTAWILRFLYNLRNRDNPKSGALSIEELKTEELYWIKWAQRDRFAREIESLEKGQPVPRASRIANLDPQLVDGVLRVGGRKDRADIPWETKHPIILDHGQDVTRLIVTEYHQKLRHVGVEHVFNHLRERFWILRGRAEVKECTIKCPLCHRRRVQPMTQKMSDLPAVRLAGVSTPFKHVGLDYAGPFQVRVGRNRVEKRYVCLFTCLHMRAVHLETAHSLDTDSFIMALRRFRARRGNPVRIMSDNGSNFVGAERELREALQELSQERIADELSVHGVKWDFNPTDGPWFGGAWEVLVKSTKRTMRVTLGNVLTLDEVFCTRRGGVYTELASTGVRGKCVISY